jgi:hypothetical protein
MQSHLRQVLTLSQNDHAASGAAAAWGTHAESRTGNHGDLARGSHSTSFAKTMLISEAIVHHRGELLRRLARPFWYQPFYAAKGWTSQLLILVLPSGCLSPLLNR